MRDANTELVNSTAIEFDSRAAALRERFDTESKQIEERYTKRVSDANAKRDFLKDPKANIEKAAKTYVKLQKQQ